MPKRKEPKDIAVIQIDTDYNGVRSRTRYFVTETYAREELGLSDEWLTQCRRGVL